MKYRNIGPKCNGTDIIRVEGKAGAYGVGNNIQVGWTNFSAILVHRYLCNKDQRKEKCYFKTRRKICLLLSQRK